MTIQGQGRILVVEDAFVRAFVTAYLEKHGFTVISLEARQAFEQLRSGGLHADLLITNTPTLFAGTAGNAPLLYVAAFPDPTETAGFARSHMLRKPFRPEQLLAAVTELLSGMAAASQTPPAEWVAC